MTETKSKKDYLSKYLSGGDKKKKKRRVVTSSATFKTSKVVDDDIDLKNMRPVDENDLDIYDLTEDAPQIAGIIDERPDDVKVMSQYRETKKWKVVTREYEDVQITATGGSDSDPSPPRPNAKDTDSDVSVNRKSKKYDSDNSPPRKLSKASKVKNYDSGNGSPRKTNKITKTKNYDSDESPPRKPSKTSHSKKYDSDASPPLKRTSRADSDNDSSKRKYATKILNASARPDNDSDESPPRRPRGERQNLEGDVTPRGKKGRGGDDVSDWRAGRQQSPHRSNRNLSPSRKRPDTESHRRHKESKMEGSRQRNSERDERHNKSTHNDEVSRLKKTLDGKKAGLQNAADMKKEADELRRRHAESLSQLGDDVSGRGAAAIMRDRRTGRKRDFHEEARLDREKKAKQAEIVEKYAVWGKGMKQIEDKTEKMKSDLHEMSKPVARYADDEDLEAMQKNEEKEGDPMLEYMRHKRQKEGKTGPAKPQYQGSYMPNRYNIKPGHKWDGVDRSSGYEKRLFEERSNKKALDEEAYKWSTEDM